MTRLGSSVENHDFVDGVGASKMRIWKSVGEDGFGGVMTIEGRVDFSDIGIETV